MQNNDKFTPFQEKVLASKNRVTFAVAAFLGGKTHVAKEVIRRHAHIRPGAQVGVIMKNPPEGFSKVDDLDSIRKSRHLNIGIHDSIEAYETRFQGTRFSLIVVDDLDDFPFHKELARIVDVQARAEPSFLLFTTKKYPHWFLSDLSHPSISICTHEH